MAHAKNFGITFLQSIVALLVFIVFMKILPELTNEFSGRVFSKKLTELTWVIISATITGVFYLKFGLKIRYAWAVVAFLIASYLTEMYDGVNFTHSNGILAILVLSFLASICLVAQKSYWVHGIVSVLVLSYFAEPIALFMIHLINGASISPLIESV